MDDTKSSEILEQLREEFREKMPGYDCTEMCHLISDLVDARLTFALRAAMKDTT